MLDGSLTLVIPAHNEAANIEAVLSGCRTVLPQLSTNWQIILVDDGSTDATQATARTAMGEDATRLRIIRHEHKSGYALTVGDGLRAADSDYVAFMDGDGQFDPKELQLLANQFPQADLAAGWRRRRADPAFRLVIAGVFNVLVRVLYGVTERDVDCALKLMRHSVLQGAMPLLARSALLNTELYFKTRRNGFRIIQVPITHHPRVKGVRSGARLIPILRAVRDLVLLRLRLAREWKPAQNPERVAESS